MLEAILQSCKKAALAVSLSLGMYGCGDTDIVINNYINFNDGGQMNSDGEQVDSGLSQSNIIEIYSTGFLPETLSISIGEIVTFINKDTNRHWPASDPHPLNNAYPGSGIQKCGTAEKFTTFDSCGGLLEGETYSFTFNYEGTHSYHDHLNPVLRGTVVVGGSQ